MVIVENRSQITGFRATPFPDLSGRPVELRPEALRAAFGMPLARPGDDRLRKSWVKDHLPLRALLLR